MLKVEINTIMLQIETCFHFLFFNYDVISTVGRSLVAEGH